MAFQRLDEEMMRKIIVTMIHPRLEHTGLVWSPSKIKDIRGLERIQRAATKLVPSLQDLSYEQRLSRLNLPTLEQRRERGYLIAVYRMMNGLEILDQPN